jgi:hypothetical protein
VLYVLSVCLCVQTFSGQRGQEFRSAWVCRLHAMRAFQRACTDLALTTVLPVDRWARRSAQRQPTWARRVQRGTVGSVANGWPPHSKRWCGFVTILRAAAAAARQRSRRAAARRQAAAAAPRRLSAAAPRRPPKSWPIRGGMLVPAQQAWTLNHHYRAAPRGRGKLDLSLLLDGKSWTYALYFLNDQGLVVGCEDAGCYGPSTMSDLRHVATT